MPAARAGFASRKQFVLPTGTYRLYGWVKDEDVYLSGVRVELTSGPATGMAVIANGFFYFYGVSDETEIRVSARLKGTLEAARITTPAPYYPSNTFAGSVEPNRVLFTLSSYGGDAPGDFYPPSVLEEIKPAPLGGESGPTHLTIYGSVVAAATGTGYAGTLNGSFEVLISPGPWDYGDVRRVASCSSGGHQIVLAR